MTEEQTEARSRLLAIVEKLPQREQEYYLADVGRLPPLIADMSCAAEIQEMLDGINVQVAMNQWLMAVLQARLAVLNAQSKQEG